MMNVKNGRQIFRRDGSYGDGFVMYVELDHSGKALWADNVPRTNSDPSTNDNTTIIFNPEVDDPQWPGAFYYSQQGPVGVTLNIRYDSYPEETMWAWKKMNGDDNQTWIKIDSKPDVGLANVMMSYDQEIDDYPGLYKFEVSDTSGDGNCCEWGAGYFTITNSTGVVWQSAGDTFDYTLDAYIWVNAKGETQAAKRIPGLGYVLVTEHNQSVPISNSESITTGSATIEVVVKETNQPE